MKKISRRKFIGASALASGSFLVPKFLKAFEKNPLSGLQGDKVLVIIQLSGGNDGLNTIIPYENDYYYNSRPQLAIKKTTAIKLTDHLGMNPVMEPLKRIYDDGNMCIINSVGYPNPDHSHFRSMDIWHTASDSNQYIKSGWLGRYLDASCPDCTSHQAIEVDDMLSFALKGERVNGFAFQDPEKLFRAVNDPYFKKLSSHHTSGAGNNVDFMYKVMRETISSADYIYEQSRIYRSMEIYPDQEFSKNLKTIAELIISGTDTKVYYVSISGFDTHIRQQITQEKLLKTVSDGLLAFTSDLKKNDKLDEVMIVTFSEFGRRVKQNASGGTDHGTANNMMIISGGLKKNGFFNEDPDLIHLDSGNLKYKIDFRNVYATLLRKWLGVNDELILGKKFEQLSFV